MKKICLFMGALLLNSQLLLFGQKVGIGTTDPQATLDVNGSAKANSLVIATGGNQHDFLLKSTAEGQIGYRKGHGALAINFIICVQGVFPSPSGSGGPAPTQPFIGEIKMFAGNYAPENWALCNGQLLPIVTNQSLFAIIGITYGGNGSTHFALPDLQGVAPVCFGSNPAGYSWAFGQKSN